MTVDPRFDLFWVPVLLVLTVYRLTRLVTQDDFPPVLWVRDRLAGGWRPLTSKELEGYYRGSPAVQAMLRTDWSYNPEGELHERYVTRKSWSPHWLAELITCPWCASGWLAGCVVGLTDLTVGLPVPWLFGPAVWGAAALLASREWA